MSIRQENGSEIQPRDLVLNFIEIVPEVVILSLFHRVLVSIVFSISYDMMIYSTNLASLTDGFYEYRLGCINFIF